VNAWLASASTPAHTAVKSAGSAAQPGAHRQARASGLG